MAPPRPPSHASQRQTPRPLRRGRGLPALVASGATALLAAAVCGHAWVPSTSWSTHSRSSRSGGLVTRRASEVYISDAGPKGRQVLEVYNKLLGETNEKVAQEAISRLDPEQKAVLKKLIEVKGGADKPITTTDPELGDTPARLAKKYNMLPDDEAVLKWRMKLDPKILQEIQEVIEIEQSKLADAEAAQSWPDEAAAKQAWEFFKKQFPKPAKNGLYFSTPVREPDIKYRFRRLKENLQIDDATALAIAEKDSSPFVVDPNFIRRAWKGMLLACESREDALNNLVLKHPGSLMAPSDKLKEQIQQAKLTASLIDAASGFWKSVRSLVPQD